MTNTFGQLTAPNYSAKTTFADYLAYSFGGFLLVLPVLPLAEFKYFFGILTFGLYLGIFLTLAAVDLIKSVNTARLSIWNIQYIRIKMVIEAAT